MNSCGGAERLTLITMQAMLEMGFNIEITTLEKPNVLKLANAYGKKIVSVIKNIKKINILRLIDEENIHEIIKKGEYDITINTHGDIVPYYDKSFSKKNAITYCHFPSAKFFIQSEDTTYLQQHLKIDRMTSSLQYLVVDENRQKTQNILINSNRKNYLQWLKDSYDNLMKNSTILTNSYYTRNTIFNTYGIEDAIVLYPPVDVDIFRNALFSSTSTLSNEREDIVLVVSRIDPLKRIENAIYLAKLLKENNIGKKMIIVGNFELYYSDYYLHLKKIIKDFDLNDYVTLKINMSFDKLLSLMKKSKIYFHPKLDEHFGISIVEAMSAGLIPVVPHIGGQTEFVPSKYHYHTLEQAMQIISSLYDTSDYERIKISDSVRKFSSSNYIRDFKHVINKLSSGK